MKRLIALVMIAVIALPIAACGDKSGKSEKAALQLLTYVPADTPYVFAGTEAMPEDVIEKMQPMLDELKPVVTEMFGNIGTMVAESAGGAEMASRFTGLSEVMVSLMEDDAGERFGFGDSMLGVFYGNGLLPVYRIVLEDSAKFGSAVDALFAEMDTEITARSAEGIDYKNVALGTEVNLIIAEMDGSAVISIAPAPFSESSIAKLLGKTKPANALDSAELSALTEKYSYLQQGFGWIDMEQLVETFVNEPTGLNEDLFALAGDSRPELSDVCSAEIRSLATIAPRLALGYTQIDTEAMTLKPVLELRGDIAKALIPVAGKVPGLNAESSAKMKFGLGLNLGGMRDYIETYVTKLVDSPFECPELAQLNQSAMEMTQALNQPVPPMVNNFQGFFLELNNMDGIDFAQPQIPENLDVNILLAMDNVQGLIQFGQMMGVLANLPIEANGEAVQLPAEMTGPLPQAVFAAMTDDALGLSIGPGADKRASTLAAATQVSSNTLLSVSMDMGAYADLMESLQDQMSSTFDSIDTGDDGDVMDATKKQMELSARLQRAYADTFEREVGMVNITENGIEMPSTIMFR